MLDQRENKEGFLRCLIYNRNLKLHFSLPFYDECFFVLPVCFLLVLKSNK